MGYEGLGGVVGSRGHVQFLISCGFVRGLEWSLSHVVIVSGCCNHTIFVFFHNFVYVKGAHERLLEIFKIHYDDEKS